MDALPGKPGIQKDGQVALGEIVVAGNPYHGLMRAGQLEANQATKDAATSAGPTEWPHVSKAVTQPGGGGTWVFSNSASAGRSPEQQAADALIGHRWDAYTLLGGRARAIYGSPATCSGGWLWADVDGKVWRCNLSTDDWTNDWHDFNLTLTRFGEFGAAPQTVTLGPFRVDFAVPLNFSQDARDVDFMDATEDGSKSAHMVVYPVVDVGFTKPGTVVVVELSGSGASPAVTVSEWGSHDIHYRIGGTPPETLSGVPHAVHVARHESWNCANTGAVYMAESPTVDWILSNPYSAIETTLFVYFEGVTLHRVSAAYEHFSTSASSLVVSGIDVFSVETTPCSTTGSCSHYDEQHVAHSFEYFVSYAATGYAGTLAYTNLAIRLDGTDTDCYLRMRSSGLTLKDKSANLYTIAMQQCGCSDPTTCCSCLHGYSINGWWTQSYAYEALPDEGDITTTVEGDLGGLLADLVPIMATGWGDDAIALLYSPNPGNGWAKIGGDNGPVIRLECLDNHVWAFARGYGATGTEYQTNTETIKMVHTPTAPNGHPFPDPLIATRTIYGLTRFGQYPAVAYNRKTGEIVSADQAVCFL